MGKAIKKSPMRSPGFSLLFLSDQKSANTAFMARTLSALALNAACSWSSNW
jgi:hypothetical protein